MVDETKHTKGYVRKAPTTPREPFSEIARRNSAENFPAEQRAEFNEFGTNSDFTGGRSIEDLVGSVNTSGEGEGEPRYHYDVAFTGEAMSAHNDEHIGSDPNDRFGAVDGLRKEVRTLEAALDHERKMHAVCLKLYKGVRAKLDEVEKKKDAAAPYAPPYASPYASPERPSGSFDKPHGIFTIYLWTVIFVLGALVGIMAGYL